MVQSILRAAEILSAMKIPDKSYFVKDICEITGLPAATVHRILATLVSCGYVFYDERAHSYKLGAALIPLGLAAMHNVELQEQAATVLKKITKLTGEDSFLMIRVGNNGIIVKKEQGPNNLKVIENFGYEVPLHWGAIRKVLLAYQSDEFISEYVNSQLLNTPTHMAFDSSKLLRELQEIRKNAVAVSGGDYIQNGMGIGSPVFDYNGDVVGSIGIISTGSRINKNNLEKYIEVVKDCAKELSSMMGHA